ncbi:hypothetical protein FTUN_4723 [Frigoriglobus tundricola]|uniref:Uncharacterized protein n=1 Tax=Frigoriglobus tundricola TaxID=2774151 RepID=A0A6M5YNZ5_9BACT|nr:hypothetical protein FTUN_0004 [Frigoriglobus tundricola]QJW94182.1 hypothetical protein FTUN_1701 [Frigoriglobus tundricola]QJW95214.1 hypothetical protein FTUN_2756 [Frigoriglobus tundricola]QJW97158.1 hypothetical protein FTUN_4723 [Frigoriglobus tundricola]
MIGGFLLLAGLKRDSSEGVISATRREPESLAHGLLSNASERHPR